jgi:hypothetical protein
MEALREDAGALTSTEGFSGEDRWPTSISSIASFKGLLVGIALGLALWGVIGFIWWMV